MKINKSAFLTFADLLSLPVKFVDLFIIKNTGQNYFFIYTKHTTWTDITLGPAYNEQRAVTSDFFSWQEIPVIVWKIKGAKQNGIQQTYTP